LFAEEAFDAGDTEYEPVSCLACSAVHFVDPRTGAVLGAKKGGAV
jgi:hypothetical protein